jgi:hypothetical protein
VLRPRSLLPALAAVVSAAAWLVAPAAAHADAPRKPAEHTPLEVSIDRLTPSTMPETGPVRVRGTVTNVDDQEWTSIALYAFVSATPMTTSEELSDATATGEDAVVGQRITTEGTYDEVDGLAPGESVRYSLRVPRSQIRAKMLDGAPGVYWFGVHALGSNDDGSDVVADGRARTFLPLVPPTQRATQKATQKAVDAALVVPVRRQIMHAPDGSIADVDSWTESLSRGGALRALVDLGVAAGSRPITWLVDPAVPDTVQDLVDGNPPRSLGPTDGADDDDGDGGAGSASPEPSDSASADADGESAAELPANVAAAAEAGTTWLERLRDGLEDSEILTLPYGDVDVAGAADHDPQAYRDARKRSEGPLQPWGLATSPVVAPPNGYLDEAGIGLVEAGTPVLVTDRMFAGRAPGVATTDAHTLGVTSSGAVSGGPGPTERLAPIAMRQRILSEAAVRLLTPGKKPLIAVLPSTWKPDAVTGFFDGLDVPWLNLTTVSDAMQRPGVEVPADRLHYPAHQRRLELDALDFTAAADLGRVGDTLQNLLTRNDQVGGTVRDEAMTDTSYSQRLRRGVAHSSADRSRAWIEGRLRSVRIDAPKAVILSSGSGRFAATVTNGLDQPVSVRIQAVADTPLEVAVPRDTIELGPDRKTTVLLNASSSAVGIRNVTLLLTDSDDVPLGSSDDLPIRSNRVSNVIWLILGTGVALLFGAIVVRLFRRIRAAGRS